MSPHLLVPRGRLAIDVEEEKIFCCSQSLGEWGRAYNSYINALPCGFIISIGDAFCVDSRHKFFIKPVMDSRPLYLMSIAIFSILSIRSYSILKLDCRQSSNFHSKIRSKDLSYQNPKNG